jgi:hypothetical protein
MRTRRPRDGATSGDWRTATECRQRSKAYAAGELLTGDAAATPGAREAPQASIIAAQLRLRRRPSKIKRRRAPDRRPSDPPPETT